MGISNTQSFKTIELCYFLTDASDVNCQSCLECFTNNTFHVHMKGDNSHFPVIVDIYMFRYVCIYFHKYMANPFLYVACVLS